MSDTNDADFEYTDDNAQPTGAFEPPTDGETEYEFGPVADDKKVLTIAEYEALSRQSDRDAKLDTILGGVVEQGARTTALLEASEARRRAANAPKPPEELDMDALEKEIEDDILANGKAGKVVIKAATKLAENIVKKQIPRFEGVVGNLQNQLAQMVVERETSGEASKIVMDKYGKEVNDILGQLTPDQRMNPQMVKIAVNQVKAAHFDELVEAAVAERAGRGTQAKPATPARQQQTYAAKGGSSGSTGGEGKLKIPVSREQLERDAEAAGYPTAEYARMKYGRQGGGN